MRTAPRPICQSGVSNAEAASVAPEVNTICSGLPFTSAATSRLAVSISRRAARPSAWTDDGLADMSSAATMASRAEASSGALAL